MSHDASQLRARFHSVPYHNDELNRIDPVRRYSYECRSMQFGAPPLRWWFCLALYAVVLSCFGAACSGSDEQSGTSINGNNDVTYQEPQRVDYLPTPSSSIPKNTVLTIMYNRPVKKVTVWQEGGSRKVSAVPLTNVSGYSKNQAWSANLSVLDLPLGPVSLHVEWRNSETMYGSFGVNYIVTK
ncbi:hypothetical protein H8E77_19220 [bacterium]|nr:hypothetical protein [bacterium]